MNSLKTLLYFSIFSYPLTKDEIYTFSNLENEMSLEAELSELIENKIIFKIEDYYLCLEEESLVKRRTLGNKMASQVFPKAEKVSKFIAKFPFVEGVGISGSLSKGYHDENSDIDFFIITTPQRLWVARTILVLYKKLFLLNSRKHFCVNYFISSDMLEIAEKNKFTATELVTLIPMYGKEVFRAFYSKNNWTQKYYPHYDSIAREIGTVNKPLLSKIVEATLKTSLGVLIEPILLKLTYYKWKRKFKHIDREDFKVAMKSTKSVSKHHPQNFQKKVIDTLNKKYSEIENVHNIILEPEHA